MKKLKKKFIDFLRWSQKYTKTDMVYLAKGGFWLSLGQLVSTVVLFILGLVYANFWNPQSYGTYKYIISLVGILNIFTLTGMGTAVTQATARGLEGSFYSAFKEKVKWGVLGSVTALGLAGYYFYKGNTTLSLPFLIAAFLIPLMQASKIYLSFLEGKKLFDVKAKYESLWRAISALFLIFTLFITKSVFWMITVYFFSHTLLNCFFYFKTKTNLKPNKKEDPKTLSFGKHQSLIRVIGPLANHLDQLLIFHYLGAAEVAIYSFAVILPEQIRGLLKLTQSLALPKLSQKETKTIKKSIFSKTTKLILFSSLIMIAYIISAPFLYKLLFPQYLESVPYSQLFALSFLANPSLLIATLDAKMAVKERYAFTIFFDISKIILMFLLVLMFGVWGIILARLMAKFFSFLLGLFLVKRL